MNGWMKSTVIMAPSRISATANPVQCGDNCISNTIREGVSPLVVFVAGSYRFRFAGLTVTMQPVVYFKLGASREDP